MTEKKVFRFFTITDYEAEEKWLRGMHASGWKLVSAHLPGVYRFEPCTPADVIYKLDFSGGGRKQQEAFQALCRDYGWTYLCSMNGWGYYCRAAEETPAAEGELFTDDASKLQMIRSILVRRFVPFTIIFALCVIPNVILSLTGRTDSLVLSVIWYGMGIFYIWAFLHMAAGFHALTVKYGRRKHES